MNENNKPEGVTPNNNILNSIQQPRNSALLNGGASTSVSASSAAQQLLEQQQKLQNQAQNNSIRAPNFSTRIVNRVNLNPELLTNLPANNSEQFNNTNLNIIKNKYINANNNTETANPAQAISATSATPNATNSIIINNDQQKVLNDILSRTIAPNSKNSQQSIGAFQANNQQINDHNTINANKPDEVPSDRVPPKPPEVNSPTMQIAEETAEVNIEGLTDQDRASIASAQEILREFYENKKTRKKSQK